MKRRLFRAPHPMPTPPSWPAWPPPAFCFLRVVPPFSLLSLVSPFHFTLSTLVLFLPNRPCPPCVSQPPHPFTPVAVGSFPLWASAPALWPAHHPGAGLWSRPTPRSLSPGPSPSNPDAHPLAPSRTVQDPRGLVCAPSLPWSSKKIFSPERRGCGPRGVWPYKCGDPGRRTRVEKKS